MTNIKCPACGSSDIIYIGKIDFGKRYRCESCKREFVEVYSDATLKKGDI